MRNVTPAVLAVSLVVGEVPIARAATLPAASCDASAVQAAVDTAVDGDVVTIPAGTCDWSGGVGWTDKNLSVVGAGIGSTVITITSGSAFVVWTNSPAKAASRISGMTFMGAPAGDPTIITLDSQNVAGPVYGWRIDHVRFEFSNTSSLHAIIVDGISYGLIDHCEFVGGSFLGVELRSHTAHDWNSDPVNHVEGKDAWDLPLNLGSGEAVYVEDSTFSMNGGYSSAVNDQVMGGRMVFRHNQVVDAYFQTHAPGHIGRDRGGGLKYEVYGNTFRGVNFYRFAQVRSGTGVIFDNTVSGFANNNVDVDDQRADTEQGCSASGSPMFKCDGTSTYDGNVEPNGWPCVDQLGRGSGAPYGMQSSVPLYAWNNGTTPTCATGGACDNATLIVINSACPSSAAWVKATAHANGDVDFVNNGSVPKPGYTPFVYPHPLQGRRPLPPPLNLRAL